MIRLHISIPKTVNGQLLHFDLPSSERWWGLMRRSCRSRSDELFYFLLFSHVPSSVPGSAFFFTRTELLINPMACYIRTAIQNAHLEG